MTPSITVDITHIITLAGSSEHENMRGMSPTLCNMFSKGFLHSKANICLVDEQETQKNAAWMNSEAEEAEGPRPRGLASPETQ